MFQFLVKRDSPLYHFVLRLFGLRWNEIPKASNDNS